MVVHNYYSYNQIDNFSANSRTPEDRTYEMRVHFVGTNELRRALYKYRSELNLIKLIILFLLK